MEADGLRGCAEGAPSADLPRATERPKDGLGGYSQHS